MSKINDNFDLNILGDLIHEDLIVIMTDRKGIITYLNENFCNSFLYSKKEVLGKNITFLNSSLNAIEFYEEFNRDASPGRKWRGEVKHIQKNGDEFWVECTVYSMKDNIFYIKKVLSEKENRDNRSRDISEAALIGEWHVNLITDEVVWSEMTYLIHEVSSTEHKPSVETGLNFYVEEDKEKITQLFTDAVEKGTTFDAELRIQTVKGNLKWIRTIGKAVIKNKKPVAVYGTFQDIHKKKTAELGLIEFKDRLELALEASSIGIWDWNLQDDSLIWDEHMYEIYGISNNSFDEINNWESMVFPEDLAKLYENAESSILNKEMLNTRFRILRKNGEERTIRTMAKVSYNSNGEALRMVGANWDITDEINAAQELVELNNRLDIALKASQIGIWDWKIDTGELIWDERVLEIYDLDRDEFHNDFDSWAKCVLEEDLEPSRQAVTKSIETGELFNTQFRVKLKNGSIRFVKGIGRAFYNDEGEPLRMVGANWDITEEMNSYNKLHESKAFLDTIFQNIPSIIFVKNARDFKFENMNMAGAEILNIEADGLVGKTDYDFFPKDLADVFRKQDEGIVNNKVAFDSPREIIETNNKKKVVHTKKIPIMDELGRVEYILGITEDVTEQELMNEKIEKEQVKVKQALQVRSEFIANMSHEIRTPLNSILGMSELLLDEKLTPKQREMIFLVNYSGETLLNLINDILDFSKMDARKLSISNREFEFKNLVKNSVKMFEKAANNKFLSLNYEIDPQIPPFIISDEHRLNQILMNLLSNAVKFTDKGNVEVEAKLKGKQGDQILIEFIVSDTGIGIPSEVKERLFKPFEQQDASLTRKYGGTGLGLAISLELAVLLGGTIELKSKKDEGSEFVITVPVGIGTNKIKTDVSYSGENEVLEKLDINVLIVEDNSVNQLLSKSFLKKLGFNADIAENGKHALEQCEKKEYDLIFMDMQMPIMDGIEATRILRKINQEYPIIVAMTANVFEDDRKKCFDSGMNDFIAKPIKKKHIVDILVKYTDSFKKK